MASDAVASTDGAGSADQPLEAYAKACASVGCRPNKTLSRLLASCPSIDSINLNVNVVGRKGANAVIELAAQLPTLRRLLLADNYLENDNVLFLVQRLQTHSALEEIDLSHNPISHAAGKALHVFARSRRQIIAIKLDGTLINRALVRMIEATCAANAQDVPAPATHDVEETTTGLAVDDAAAVSTSARDDEEELSTMAPEEGPVGEGAVGIGESINIPAGQPEEDVVDYTPATPKTAVDFAVLPAVAACGGLRYSAVRVLLAGVDMSAVVNANGGVERPCIAAIHAVAARRAARCPAVHALWCASVLPSDDTVAVDVENSVRSVSVEPTAPDTDAPAIATASPSPVRPRRLSCLQEIVGEVAADASAEFPGLTLVIEAANDEVNAAEGRAAAAADVIVAAPQPIHSSNNINANEAVDTTGAAEASSSRSAIDVIVESSPAEYAAVAVLRDALRGDPVASTDGAAAATPEATAVAVPEASVASEVKAAPERSRDHDSSNALSVVLAGSSEEGGHEALMLLSAVLSEQ